MCILQEKITIAKPTINNPQQVNQPNQQPLQRTQPQQPAQLTTVLNTCLANIMPSLHGLRVVTNDSRQLLVTHAPATGDSRGPLIAVQQNGNSEHSRPVALVVHPTTTPNDNRVTLVHSGNLTAAGADNRPLALAVQSSGNDLGRPVTFMHSGNSEARSIVLATHPGPTINVTSKNFKSIMYLTHLLNTFLYHVNIFLLATRITGDFDVLPKV